MDRTRVVKGDTKHLDNSSYGGGGSQNSGFHVWGPCNKDYGILRDTTIWADYNHQGGDSDHSSSISLRTKVKKWRVHVSHGSRDLGGTFARRSQSQSDCKN